MLNTILGSKQAMSQIFVEDTRVPVTWVKAGPCVVTQIKKDEKDGYWAIQLGFGEKKLKNVTKPLKGHLKGATGKLKSSDNGKVKFMPRYLREAKTESEPKIKVGDKIMVSDIISEGDIVTVSGISKGKGFAGVVKRYGFAGGPRTHGQSDRLRAPGSIGQGTTPGRVHKGKKMPGRMGGETKTIKNLRIVSVNSEKGEIALSGPVPGSRGSLLVIEKIATGEISDLVAEGPKAQIVEGKPEEPASESTDDTADRKPVEGKDETKKDKPVSEEGGKKEL